MGTPLLTQSCAGQDTPENLGETKEHLGGCACPWQMSRAEEGKAEV